MSAFNYENATGNIEALSAPAVKKIRPTGSKNKEFCEEFIRTFDGSKSSEVGSVVKIFKRNAVFYCDERALKSFSDFFREGKNYIYFLSVASRGIFLRWCRYLKKFPILKLLLTNLIN